MRAIGAIRYDIICSSWLSQRDNIKIHLTRNTNWNKYSAISAQLRISISNLKYVITEYPERTKIIKFE